MEIKRRKKPTPMGVYVDLGHIKTLIKEKFEILEDSEKEKIRYDILSIRRYLEKRGLIEKDD